MSLPDLLVYIVKLQGVNGFDDAIATLCSEDAYAHVLHYEGKSTAVREGIKYKENVEELSILLRNHYGVPLNSTVSKGVLDVNQELQQLLIANHEALAAGQQSVHNTIVRNQEFVAGTLTRVHADQKAMSETLFAMHGQQTVMNNKITRLLAGLEVNPRAIDAGATAPPAAHLDLKPASLEHKASLVEKRAREPEKRLRESNASDGVVAQDMKKDSRVKTVMRAVRSIWPSSSSSPKRKKTKNIQLEPRPEAEATTLEPAWEEDGSYRSRVWPYQNPETEGEIQLCIGGVWIPYEQALRDHAQESSLIVQAYFMNAERRSGVLSQ